VNDDVTPKDEELLDAVDQAALLETDAITRVDVAAEIADAAEEAEADAIASGDLEEAARIDAEADEVITELVDDAAVEAELAEQIVDGVEAAIEGDGEGGLASESEPAIETIAEVEPPTEELVVVPEAEPHVVPPAEPEIVDATGADPFKAPGDWYVVHTYAGYENKVKANLESRIHTMQMEDKIFRVHIPMEDVMEIKSGKKQIVQKKVFPGYLLVKMLYDNDSWYVVRNTPGVTGFVSAGTGSKPTPLSKREVEKILAVKKEEQKPQVRLGFEEGDVVRIISGPFSDFNGTISEINPDQAKLKVLVNIFDRETPVELSFDQVAKV